ncbi:MAG: hypothetical protein NZ895_00785 [Archaeoglobaceae archaeon]|nr:hypothetical protein [Archaeoglobaceae archaeon]MCX8151955.1 hypothetical protein [Archaeoglobaceae archaeon]MDW8013344.1 hypothetical protein [Archaeoglobaceae archaeon]
MITWIYRPVNNRLARRKWISVAAVLFFLGLIYTFYKTYTGYPFGRSIIALTVYTLFLLLYILLALGRPRTYILENNTVKYKPFKAKIKEYSVDEKNLVIKIKGNFFIRTLYFERDEDLREVLRYLRRLKTLNQVKRL